MENLPPKKSVSELETKYIYRKIYKVRVQNIKNVT